ncbi:uncharacterized protein LOC111381231 [Olea europaea var. sylvestris]|uniref:uncharacterized protein LOC111381230 n=1 Tax=Olea europaea var. sylvestris TaxID=158386 RepID=UPI000C1D3022|nr:uncharacterized protein LOC111381230 [Olea europaea var. sylvestris]XP_022860756.1 uncharacterized protein LOC111381231 [Olea europaea var. sylvestris]
MAGLKQKEKGTKGFTLNTLFTPEILSFPLLDRFKYSSIKEYDGTTDSRNHLNIYIDVMNLQVAPDQVMCKAFPQILTNTARDWFSTLEPNSISSFADLTDKFSTFFASSKLIRKMAAFLMQLYQGQNETFRDFMTRFNKERLQIPNLHINAVVSALTHAIRLTELLTRSEKYINMEETLSRKRIGLTQERAKHKRPYDSSQRQEAPRNKQRQETPPSLFSKILQEPTY